MTLGGLDIGSQKSQHLYCIQGRKAFQNCKTYGITILGITIWIFFKFSVLGMSAVGLWLMVA